jgi:tetratricopeptide (TPR) repeat protein
MTDYDKGRICYYLQDYENARNYLETARDENNRDVMLLLGQTYEALTDFNYAASVYSNYLLENPDAKMYNQLGLCKMHLTDYSGALESFQAGILLEDIQMKQTLSFNEIIAYEYLGEFTKAGVLMETYIASYPEDTEALREYQFLISR